MVELTKPLAKYIDHTMLKPDATEAEIDKLLAEAKEYHFASVCVNPYWVKKCAQALKDSDVNVVTVIGFPLGATSTASKVAETKQAIADGADECDMVENIGELLAGHYDTVLADEKAVAEAAHAGNAKLKVILENCFLSNDQIVKACQIAEQAGADFVKTSTGFAKWGAKAEDVKLMKQTVGDRLEVKAAGGIHTKDDAMEMIANGATRLGASAGVKIIGKEN
ncbi:MAG: deoxyribose-phosphate aldolase [Lactobacillus sp.]|jgi:deoxyribose-phosphate aldolase|nr:deoxyribose-phosphate aldolase [Lactobacillus sp.]MCH3905573.1 deoxyribose-phosphate aldolase [Lactobacillus sp.]MCH3990868.1 deoxyribose-phosphate aldolase [Lactobacillus sp.]MCH4068416.1 deoxyribose-phosphate aldolase [Lactobacillus sp.]MCI1304556.1 deoxyribose-phosphate aldolase [Lactobacillus sp.]